VAEYFDVDPVIVRIAAVVLALSGPGVIAYLLAWIFVPEAAPTAAQPPPAATSGHDRGTQILGVLLLAVSVSVLWGGWWSPARRWMFPFGLMALGAWLLLRRDHDDVAHLTPSAPPAPAPPAVPRPEDTSALDPTLHASSDEDAAALGADATLVDPIDGGTGSITPPPPWDTQAWSTGPSPDVPDAAGAVVSRRRRRLVFPTVMGALLLWAGAAFLTGVSLQTGLAVGLCIVGLGFVLGAFVGGSWALIVPAVVLGAALVVTSVVDIPLQGPVGSRTWSPQSLDRVADHYELSIGEGVLDLTDLPFGQADHVAIAASVGVGHLRVQVPAGVTVEVHARAGAGDTLLFGESNSGMGVEIDRRYGDASGGDAGALRLDLEVGLGQVEVVVGSGPARRDDPTTGPVPTASPTPTSAPDPTTSTTVLG
jgi:hypothetical protein